MLDIGPSGAGPSSGRVGGNRPAAALRVAVIGAGAAGLAAAWRLADDPGVAVTSYEASAHPGGHAHTVTIDTSVGPRAVDTGFMVYNERNYPQFTALLAALGVETRPSDMSFAVSLDDGALEYAGSQRLSTMLAQKSNLLHPRFWRMVRDIVRFNREAAQLDDSASLGEVLATAGYSEGFVQDHLLPMVACIWSVPIEEAASFPVRSVRAFFANHGLLELRDRPEWRVVKGGSETYVRRMLAMRPIATRLATPVRGIERRGHGVIVHTATGEAILHDAVIMATHADTTLTLLEQPSAAERAFLGAQRYANNIGYLHSDVRLMPVRRAAWASWNYLGRRGGGRGSAVAVTYWLNRLQGLDCPEPVFLSLNPERPPFEAMTWRRLEFRHPLLSHDPLARRPALDELQGGRHTWYCGSYVGYGFHEDAIASGFAAADSVRTRFAVATDHGRVSAHA